MTSGKNWKNRVIGGVAGGLLMASIPLTTFAAPVNQTANQINFGQLISALNNINAQISNVYALNNLTVSDVRLVNVQDVANGNNIVALNNALNRNNILDNNTILQNFLNNSLNNNNVNVIRDVLNNNNIAIGQVVGIDVLNGTVYVLYLPQGV